MKAFKLLVAIGLVALAIPASATASTIYYFDNITNNSDVNAAGDFAVEVIDVGGGQVAFKFTNTGANGASITDIYFDDGSLLGIASITDSGAGVAFSQGASPPNLSGGNTLTPPFEVTAGFLADSDSPVEGNGVNGGEWVQITFDLINGKTYADTLAALQLAGGESAPDLDDGLRIGIHVQSIEGTTMGSDSDAFVNRVPDGGTTLSLLGGALLGLGLLRRKFNV